MTLKLDRRRTSKVVSHIYNKFLVSLENQSFLSQKLQQKSLIATKSSRGFFIESTLSNKESTSNNRFAMIFNYDMSNNIKKNLQTTN